MFVWPEKVLAFLRLSVPLPSLMIPPASATIPVRLMNPPPAKVALDCRLRSLDRVTEVPISVCTSALPLMVTESPPWVYLPAPNLSDWTWVLLRMSWMGSWRGALAGITTSAVGPETGTIDPLQLAGLLQLLSAAAPVQV